MTAVLLLAVGPVVAQGSPGSDRPGRVVFVPPDDPGSGPGIVPANIDLDRDGFVAAIDCNDDDPAMNPNAVEKANGKDDNCDGIVDDGFDTTIDSPQVEFSSVVWPGAPAPAPAPGEFVSIDKPPRLVWTGDRFLAVWIDARRRMRLARFDARAEMDAPPQTLREMVTAMDVAWTGTRLGVAYEDGLTANPSVRLMTLDRYGQRQVDVALAAPAADPKIAWGQDRFGVVWRVPAGLEVLRFQRFGPSGDPLTAEEVLENSGAKSALTYDGTIVVPQKDGTFAVHEGRFGVAYEALYAWTVTGDVLLKTLPRDARLDAAVGPVRVNQDDEPFTARGAMPAIAANQSGFLVSWVAGQPCGQDRANARFFSHDALDGVQGFYPDQDAARYGRLTWTGSEFVMANDNRTGRLGGASEVHVRRFDASGNTHVTSPSPAWSEVKVGEHVRTAAAVHPDVVVADALLGVIWVERDVNRAGSVGRLWFARIAHK